MVLADGSDAVDMVSRRQLGTTLADFKHDGSCLAAHDSWKLDDEHAGVLHEGFANRIRYYSGLEQLRNGSPLTLG